MGSSFNSFVSEHYYFLTLDFIRQFFFEKFSRTIFFNWNLEWQPGSEKIKRIFQRGQPFFDILKFN